MNNNGIIHFLVIQVRIKVITLDEVPDKYRDRVRSELEK